MRPVFYFQQGPLNQKYTSIERPLNFGYFTFSIFPKIGHRQCHQFLSHRIAFCCRLPFRSRRCMLLLLLGNMHPWTVLKEVLFLFFLLSLLTLYMCKIATLTGIIHSRILGYQWILTEKHNLRQPKPIEIDQSNVDHLMAPLFAECCFCNYLRHRCCTHYSCGQ